MLISNDIGINHLKNQIVTCFLSHARFFFHAATSAERAARWWAVRKAGGTYKLLRKMPEALPRLSLSELADMSRPLCSKAGLKLSQWGPVRFLKNGEEVLMRIPPEKGLKYLGKQAAVAGVGIVGFRKMEEHLSSRRPQPHVD